DGVGKEMRRVADHEVPLFRRRDRTEIIGMIDRNTIPQPVVANSAPAGGHRLLVDVGDAQRFAEAVRQQRETDEGRSGAPFEPAAELGCVAVGQERQVSLPLVVAAAVEMPLIVHPEAGVAHAPPRLEIATPKLSPIAGHGRSRTKLRRRTVAQALYPVKVTPERRATRRLSTAAPIGLRFGADAFMSFVP